MIKYTNTLMRSAEEIYVSDFVGLQATQHIAVSELAN